CIELNRLPYLVASSIWNNMEDESDEYFHAVLQGMKAADADIKPSTFTEYGECEKQKKYKAIQKNVEEADRYLRILDQNHEYTKVFDLPLFYRILNNGQGKVLQLPSEVLINYSFAYLDDEIIADTFKKQSERLNLNDVVPGFGLGMKVGEEREILIHPSLGYGIFTSLKKGVFLKAKVQLVDIIAQEDKDGNKFEVNLANTYVIDLKNDLETLGIYENSRLADLMKAAGFSYGYQVWNHYKKGALYSLEKVIDQIMILSRINLYSELSRDDENLLNHLHWVLYL
ncbi:MAG TPA: hypothetical protein VGP47_03725, partial [Parachlamydiaceae bacterium]|nr:hypothetical protein [Parachlamydiaceae bacterium]